MGPKLGPLELGAFLELASGKIQRKQKLSLHVLQCCLVSRNETDAIALRGQNDGRSRGQPRRERR